MQATTNLHIIMNKFFVLGLLTMVSVTCFGQVKSVSLNNSSNVIFEIRDHEVFLVVGEDEPKHVYTRKGNTLFHAATQKRAVTLEDGVMYAGKRKTKSSILFVRDGDQYKDHNGEVVWSAEGNTISYDEVSIQCEDAEASHLEMLTAIEYLYYYEDIVMK